MSPPFPTSNSVYNSSGVSCTCSPLLRPPQSCPSPPVPGLWFFAGCDGLAGASGLAAGAVGCSLASPPLWRLPTHLYYLLKYSQALSLFHPLLYSRLRSHSRSCSHPYPRAHSRTVLVPPRSCSRHRFLPPVPGDLLVKKRVL